MRYWLFFLVVSLSACQPKVIVHSLEKAQLRNTLREGYYQFNVNMWVDLQGRNPQLGASELEVTVNNTYLGEAVIAADTRPLEPGRNVLGLRVVFPNDRLVLTTPNSIHVHGYLTVNGKRVKVFAEDSDMHILNLTGM